MVKSTTTTPAKETKKKVSASTKKTSAVKKTAAKVAQPTATPAALSALNILKTWFNGWKQTFNLKGRSSRFDLWAFLLTNSMMMVVVELKCLYIMSERYLLSAQEKGYSLDMIERHVNIADSIFYLAIFLPLFPIVSLLVRRMHDLGKLAWANYFEPLLMSLVVISLLMVALTELSNTDFEYTALCLSVCFVTLTYGAGFYALKVLITTMFYRGDAKENAFGPSLNNDDEHETAALNLSCLYFLFLITLGLLHLAIALA